MIGTNLKESGSPERLVGRAAAFGLHTLAVYICAIHFSPWLVGRWFAWVAPPLTMPPEEWYLRHLELVSIVPALIVGYIAALWPNSVAPLAWTGPMLVLICKMLLYHDRSSVLAGTSISALRYFFDIQPFMPTMMNLTTVDPIRALAQITITAPFYAGVAYSIGAWISKRKVLASLFSVTNQQE